jgi:cysteine desulfurase
MAQIRRIYLDNNATTPLDPAVLEALLPFYREVFGNPSSIHQEGRRARQALETAREQVACLVGCNSSEIIFTSSGTEADVMALLGVCSALRSRGNHLITISTEHPAVLNTCRHLQCQGVEVTIIPVDRQGIPDLEQLEKSICERTILISAMYANNETGTVLPVQEIATIARRRKIAFHCDAVQAVGKIPIEMRRSSIDLLAISGHKLYSPKGVGALAVRSGIKLHPLMHGGSQERNRRGGTENVGAIVGFGIACELALQRIHDDMKRIAALKRRLLDGIGLIVPDVVHNGHREHSLPNTLNLSFPGLAADSLLMGLDLAGIAVSSGSACSSGTIKESPVLRAMGVPSDLARCSLRFSLGRQNTEEEIDTVLELFPEIVARARKE